MTDGLINQAALDRFTSAHAGVGVTMAVANLPWWGAFAISIGWELIENWLKDQKPNLFPYSSHDSSDNSWADSLAVIVGFITARHLMRRGMTHAGKAALGSAVGSTLGCLAGSGLFGLGGRLYYGEPDSAARGESPSVAAGRVGYMVGGGLGGAVGSSMYAKNPYKEEAALGGATGGAAFGPMGAALGTYVAVGIAEDVE